MRLLAAFSISLVLGLGSAYWAVQSGLAAEDLRSGPWRTSLTTGSAEASAYTRARVAVAGLLALAPSETIYFTAVDDSDGEPLRANCDYRLVGGGLPARWWSVTAYAADHFLIPNDAGVYSISRTSVRREAQGGPWTASVSSRASEGNWLPSGRPGDAGAFSLTLRLYNPAPSVARDPARVVLPSIVREACR